MDHAAAVSEFLRTRRDRITPEQAGIIGGGRRRVPGLRREEVAMLTGISVEYYARMERGALAGVSLEVLDALARALQLTEAEYDHLGDLARTSAPTPPRRRRARPSAVTVTPELQRFLDAVTGAPMWVRDLRLNFVAANALGRALYSPLLDDPANGGNTARFTFLNPAARQFFPDWEQNADDVVATLRSYAGQNPLDRGLTDLIGELVTRSDEFRYRWSAHNVRHHRTGVKRLRHPDLGDLEFSYQAMALPEHPDWFMFAFITAPRSPTEERIRLLGSLAATGPADSIDPAHRGA